MAKKSVKRMDTLTRATEIAETLIRASTESSTNKTPPKPDRWTKALIIANVFLAIFTFWYVWLTFNVLSEMKQQSELARRNLQETVRPHLLMTIDSLQLHVRPFGGHPANTVTAQVHVQNNGNTPADVEFVFLDALPQSRLEVNVRDSLLNPTSTATTFYQSTSQVSKFIPPHNAINFIAVIPDISGRIRTDGTFYIHYVIIFKDAYNSYRDVYSVTRFEIDSVKRAISTYPPAYSFHDYVESEIRLLAHKSDSTSGHK